MSPPSTCDGEVRLVVSFQGNSYRRTGRCRNAPHLGAPCSTKVALLDLFGHKVELEVEWEGPSGPQPEKTSQAQRADGIQPQPPQRPGTWSESKS